MLDEEVFIMFSIISHAIKWRRVPTDNTGCNATVHGVTSTLACDIMIDQLGKKVKQSC